MRVQPSPTNANGARPTKGSAAACQQRKSDHSEEELIVPEFTKRRQDVQRLIGLQAVSLDAERRELAQIEKAKYLAHLGGRHVLEALRAARRGQSIVSVLEEFQRIPRWRGLRVVGVAA